MKVIKHIKNNNKEKDQKRDSHWKKGKNISELMT